MLDIFTVSVWQMSAVFYNDVVAVTQANNGNNVSPAKMSDVLFIVSYSSQGAKIVSSKYKLVFTQTLKSQLICGSIQLALLSLNLQQGN